MISRRGLFRLAGSVSVAATIGAKVALRRTSGLTIDGDWWQSADSFLIANGGRMEHKRVIAHEPITFTVPGAYIGYCHFTADFQLPPAPSGEWLSA
jgi:hypothetical protein